MTFTLKCPNCGHSLGHGHHAPTPDGKEITNITLTAHSDPPVERAQHPPEQQREHKP